MSRPIRIQRKRTKGYDMQAESRAINGLECVYVGRPTVYGNPCISAEAFQEYIYSGLENRICRGGSMNVAFDAMSGYKRRKKLIEKLPKLRGKNLACFCPIDQPCHADVLLELANR